MCMVCVAPLSIVDSAFHSSCLEMIANWGVPSPYRQEADATAWTV